MRYIVVFIIVLNNTFSTAKIVVEAMVEAVAVDSVVTVATKAVVAEADGETRGSSRITMAMMEATGTNTKEVETGIKGVVVVVVVATGIKEVKVSNCLCYYHVFTCVVAFYTKFNVINLSVAGYGGGYGGGYENPNKRPRMSGGRGGFGRGNKRW